MTLAAPLSADDVSRSYDQANIVSSVNLTLEPGKVTALLGSSGAGKSTLLRLFAGLEPVDAGQIRLGETVLSSARATTPPEKRRIGLIFQDFALFPHMTATQNIMFGLTGQEKSAQKAMAHSWLERMDLSARANAYPHELSGGEQQRIAIARALAPEPAAILMDEPFSGLDPSLRASVRDVALRVIRDAGIPALLVTHDATEALSGADHIAIMKSGKILQQGPAEEVYFHPRLADVAMALGPLQRLARTDVPAALTQVLPGDGDILAIRPESVVVDPSAPTQAVIEEIAFNGAYRRVTLRIDQIRLVTHLDHTIAANIGDIVDIRLDPRAAFIFPSGSI